MIFLLAFFYSPFLIVSRLVSSMSMEELRFFYHIPDIISLEVLDDPTVSKIGEADSAVYFTLE